MPNMTKFAAIVLVYFLLVYLFPVKRGRQPLLLWVFLIAVQAMSVLYFPIIYALLYNMPVLEALPAIAVQLIVGAILVAVNMALILGLNMVFLKNSGNDAVDGSDVEVDMDNVQLNFKPEPVQHINLSKDSENESAEFEVSFDDDFGSSFDHFHEEPEENIQNNDEAAVFDSIQEMISNGNTEKAIKHLKIVAFYGTSEVAKEKAKAILRTIEESN